jgi:hypothetical protein
MATIETPGDTSISSESMIDTPVTPGSETQSDTGNLPIQTSETQPFPPAAENTERMASTLPMAPTMFASTRIGAYTVGALGQAFGSGADFSLISFSGNNNSFLVQFQASSAAAATQITEAMQRNTSPENMRTVSKSDGNGVLVLGRVGERAGMMGPQTQQRMTLTSFTAWLKKLAADNGLATKLFDVSQAYSSDGTTRTPMQTNFSGDKAGVFNFLKSLADAGPNIVTTKIIVSPSDRRSQSNANLDVVLLFDFIE